MKLIKYLIGSIICSILVINNCYSVENKILFKVNNEIITSVDILNELQYLITINPEFKKTNKSEAIEISKNSLIREKIKEIEIKRIIEEIRIEDKTLEKLILNNFNEFQIKSILDFEKFFLKNNIDPNLIKKKISIEVLWNQLIYSNYIENIKIDEEIIKNNLINNEKQKEFLIAEILFNIDENENLNKKLDLIEDSIKKKNFSQTALTYSIADTANKGGNLGWVTETVLSKNIYKEIKNLNNGEHTKPILVPGGFLILQLLDSRETTKNFNINKEIKKIVENKTNQQLNRFSNIYFNKVKKDIIINEF